MALAVYYNVGWKGAVLRLIKVVGKTGIARREEDELGDSSLSSSAKHLNMTQIT